MKTTLQTRFLNNSFIKIQIILLFFVQCKSKSEIQQEKQIIKKVETEQIVKSKINQENHIVDKINFCKNICLLFPKTISKNQLIKSVPIEIVVENNTENIVIAGEKYKIEKFYGGKWSKIEFEGIFTDVGYKIYPKSKLQINIPTFLLRNLSPGKYKIYQDVITLPNKTEVNFINEFFVTE